MNLSEYSQYDGLGLAQRVRVGEISPGKLAELVMHGVEKVNPQINSVMRRP